MADSLIRQPPLAQYALLDSGGAEKLERFGPRLLRRPDPQALWRRRLPVSAWEAVDLRFVRESDRGGRWEPRGAPAEWPMRLGAELGLPEITLLIRPTPFKHVGLFPEQAANWVWTEERRRALAAAGVDPPHLLHLFAYTGAATLLAARSGWKVTHVDAARPSLDWAAENARASALPAGAVRWVLDDAAAFAAREARRGRSYHGILLDPPHYGRGPRGEKWQFEDGIAPLLESCGRLLAPGAPSFLILSTYAIGYSPLAFDNMLRELGPGSVESGELAIAEESEGRTHPSRLLPCGFCARFVRA
ncbi:MAG: class I SAM-dependent rRNA methyltransferase [Planctomycetota bacterium]|nr:MAG: class I SAM-dependent rRNA methyltransferase [Planctomycetota bacterium]